MYLDDLGLFKILQPPHPQSKVIKSTEGAPLSNEDSRIMQVPQLLSIHFNDLPEAFMKASSTLPVVQDTIFTITELPTGPPGFYSMQKVCYTPLGNEVFTDYLHGPHFTSSALDVGETSCLSGTCPNLAVTLSVCI